MIFSVKDTFRAMVEYDSDGKNTVIYDDYGNPNVVVIISKYDMKLLGIPELPEGTHPAFIINGEKEVDEIFVAKYDSVLGDGNVAISMMGNHMNFPDYHTDEMVQKCVRKKGKGWHAMTVSEYAAIALVSWKLNRIPHGNIYRGYSVKSGGEYGIPTAIKSEREFAAGICEVRSGTGPTTWSHDGTTAGVYDLVGNRPVYYPGSLNVRGEFLYHGIDGVYCNMVDVDDSPDINDVHGYIRTGIYANGCTDGETIRLAKSCTTYGLYSLEDDSRENAESLERFGKYTRNYHSWFYEDLRTHAKLDGVTIPWIMYAMGTYTPSADVTGKCGIRIGGKRLCFRGTQVNDKLVGYDETMFESHYDQCDRHVPYDHIAGCSGGSIRCAYIP